MHCTHAVARFKSPSAALALTGARAAGSGSQSWRRWASCVRSSAIFVRVCARRHDAHRWWQQPPPQLGGSQISTGCTPPRRPWGAPPTRAARTITASVTPRWGSVAMLLCTTHSRTLYTISTNIFGTSFSETTMRPTVRTLNPSGARPRHARAERERALLLRDPGLRRHPRHRAAAAPRRAQRRACQLCAPPLAR
jgi:hypothetical protein